jgi:hypothetical protein
LQRVKKPEANRLRPATKIKRSGRCFQQNRETVMLRIILATTAVVGASYVASAQELTAAQRAACTGDYQKFCKSVMPGGGRIIACLSKQTDNLTPACKKELLAAEKK